MPDSLPETWAEQRRDFVEQASAMFVGENDTERIEATADMLKGCADSLLKQLPSIMSAAMPFSVILEDGSDVTVPVRGEGLDDATICESCHLYPTLISIIGTSFGMINGYEFIPRVEVTRAPCILFRAACSLTERRHGSGLYVIEIGFIYTGKLSPDSTQIVVTAVQPAPCLIMIRHIGQSAADAHINPFSQLEGEA